ncbi:NAD-dependent epimerase/dehydratase family protein [Citrifermentans bremense]|uniref:NAD-dependent epimerase/dehydratase family protein n=1 Tax=Citrifermentans bremense TaxID=60035 RepID=UPI00047DB7FC|nr:NAD(P)-dependent oxidoreductase [Citrifermentans bremense]
MKIVVTGCTGFVGRHLVASLVARGHSVVAVARRKDQAIKMPWYKNVEFISVDLHDPVLEPVSLLGVPNALIHLAWPGIPNYKDLLHIEQYLPADYSFIKKMVEAGTPQVLVSGTCFEYGMQNGALSEDTIPLPNTPYGIAKDSLRRFLEALQAKKMFNLQWVRLFYLYGPGQHRNSLLAQLDRAIDNGDEFFNMSGGEQLRDYLHVEEVAVFLSEVLEQPQLNGIFNCCNGSPISVRRLVEMRIRERGSGIKLNLGHYPYPDYEPMAFWGKRQTIKDRGE